MKKVLLSSLLIALAALGACAGGGEGNSQSNQQKEEKVMKNGKLSLLTLTTNGMQVSVASSWFAVRMAVMLKTQSYSVTDM